MPLKASVELAGWACAGCVGFAVLFMIAYGNHAVQWYEVSCLDAWGCYGWRTYPITLRITMKVRNLLEEAYPMSMMTMEPAPQSEDGSHWILKTEVCSFSGVAQFIMGLIKEVEILEGEGLKRHLKKKLLETQEIIDRL